SLALDPQTGRPTVVGVHTFGYSLFASHSAEDGWNDVITLWDAESGELLGHGVYPRSDPDPPGLVSPDGRLLARHSRDSSPGKTVVLDAPLHGRGGFLLEQPDALSPPSLFTPDGQTLIALTTARLPENAPGPATGASTVRLWEVRTGRQRLEFPLPFTVRAVGKAARFEPL